MSREAERERKSREEKRGGAKREECGWHAARCAVGLVRFYNMIKALLHLTMSIYDYNKEYKYDLTKSAWVVK